jgi:hypothetical protein
LPLQEGLLVGATALAALWTSGMVFALYRTFSEEDRETENNVVVLDASERQHVDAAADGHRRYQQARRSVDE